MVNQILADYYEERGFIGKSIRLRKRKILLLYGNIWYYTVNLGVVSCYVRGNAYTYNYGNGFGYNQGSYKGDGGWFGYDKSHSRRLL